MMSMGESETGDRDDIDKLANYAGQIKSLLIQRDEAQAKVDAFARARDLAVADGVFWKSRCDELAAIVEHCRRYAPSVVAAAEKARAT